MLPPARQEAVPGFGFVGGDPLEAALFFSFSPSPFFPELPLVLTP